MGGLPPACCGLGSASFWTTASGRVKSARTSWPGAALGARVQVHYRAAGGAGNRARCRNAENDGDVFPISDRNLEEWAAQFEPPAEELEPYDLKTEEQKIFFGCLHCGKGHSLLERPEVFYVYLCYPGGLTSVLKISPVFVMNKN